MKTKVGWGTCWGSQSKWLSKVLTQQSGRPARHTVLVSQPSGFQPGFYGSLERASPAASVGKVCNHTDVAWVCVCAHFPAGQSHMFSAFPHSKKPGNPGHSFLCSVILMSPLEGWRPGSHAALESIPAVAVWRLWREPTPPRGGLLPSELIIHAVLKGSWPCVKTVLVVITKWLTTFPYSDMSKKEYPLLLD